MSSSIPEDPQEQSPVRNSVPGDNPEHVAASASNRSEADEQRWRDRIYDDRDPYKGIKELEEPVDEPFEVLLQPLLDRDTKQCNAWKDEVQNILIFAGLFSAVVTAFIIESYQTLQPDPNDQIILLLSRIADQMNAPTGNTSSHTDSPATSSAFVPSPSNIRVNIFWFLSLVLSLTVALIGITTLQWLRQHQLYDSGMVASKVFAIFNARSDGLKRWYVPQIFAGLPLLLQAALVLFFAGLIEFLFAIQIQVAIVVVVAVSIPILFLVGTTVLPTLQLYAMEFPYRLSVNHNAPSPCPYKSPQSFIFQRVAVTSDVLFTLSAMIFTTLWIPFVYITRAFVKTDKPFYGELAPFKLGDQDGWLFRSLLRRAAGNWISMDTEWLAIRTNYALVLHTYPNFRSIFNFYSESNITSFIGFYDYVQGLKNMLNQSDPSNEDYTTALYHGLIVILKALSHPWRGALTQPSNDPEFSTTLQVHFTGLIRIIARDDVPQTENLVELSCGDINIVNIAFLALLMDHVSEAVSDFNHPFVLRRLETHMKLTRVYLMGNTRELFRCSNRPGIVPHISESILHDSRLYHRDVLERYHLPWMEDMSRDWTWTLKNIVIDVRDMVSLQPFTSECAGSSTARCGSNLHTESIIELTQYILLYQVKEDIQDTSRFLHDLCLSKPNPVQDRPFVLIIACAYIDAVARASQHDVEEFRTLLHTICALCGAMDATLYSRWYHSKFWYWPGLESAFNYIRNNANHAGSQGVPQVDQVPELPPNSAAPYNV